MLSITAVVRINQIPGAVARTAKSTLLTTQNLHKKTQKLHIRELK